MTTLTTQDIIQLPTQDQPPCDDGIPMETQSHKLQMDILIDTLLPWLADRVDGYVGGNMFIYFNANQLRNQDFRGPDFFAVLGVPKKERKSWVVWEEKKGPDIVIELLSESTANLDKTEKKQIYQDQLRVPEYFWYDPFNPQDLAGFTLRNGLYESLMPNTEGHLLSRRLGLTLVRWSGTYKDVSAVWLRWANPHGVLLPTEWEIAEEAKQRANEAEAKANEAELKASEAELKAKKLAEKLRSLGVNPEEVV